MGCQGFEQTCSKSGLSPGAQEGQEARGRLCTPCPAVPPFGRDAKHASHYLAKKCARETEARALFFFFFFRLFLQASAEITFYRQAWPGTEEGFVWKQWLHFSRETTSCYQAAWLGRASHAQPRLQGCLFCRKGAVPATGGRPGGSYSPTGSQLACAPGPEPLIPATWRRPFEPRAAAAAGGGSPEAELGAQGEPG